MKKKFQYSKILPLITFALFCGCVIKCFSLDISNVYDLSVYATIITGSATLCLTTNVWYLKNSQAEKVARIKSETYKVISEERFKYNVKMLRLKAKYKYAEEDVNGKYHGVAPFDVNTGQFINNEDNETFTSIIAKTKIA